MKKAVSILFSFILVLCLSFALGGCGGNKTELSEDDKDILRYYHEPTIDEDFKDNVINVILKSAFRELEEISFKDLKVVEKVSHISYIDLYTKQIPYSEDGIIALDSCQYNHMFDIVLEEHSKEKVLKACDLLNRLDIVLIAGPDYVYDIVND